MELFIFSFFFLLPFGPSEFSFDQQNGVNLCIIRRYYYFGAEIDSGRRREYINSDENVGPS